ncbi:MAG: alpha/beta fold hydrolase [Sphingomonas sp.]
MTARPTLAASLVQAALAHGQAIAVDDGRERLDYNGLMARAGTLAQSIARCAEPVGILLPNGTDYIVAIVAAVLADKTYVPMDQAFPAKHNGRIAGHSGIRAIVVDDSTALQASDLGIEMISIHDAHGDAHAAGDHKAEVVVAPDRILTIFYTSGSTGEPKGVCHSEAGLLYDVGYFIENHSLHAGDVHSLLFSPSVSISNRDIFGTLLAGARLAIVDLKQLGIGRALQALGSQGVTVIHSVPSAFRALFGTDHPDAPAVVRHIRMVRLNGDRVLKRDVELYHRAFPRSSRLSLDVASTETRPYAAWMVDHDTPLRRPLVPVGYLRPDLNVALLDDHGAAVPAGEIGEIVVASQGLSAGYWRDPELTAERFVDSVRLPGMTEYRTGDFGRLLPDGLLEFVGRRDRQIKVLGNTVHLGEVEAAVASCPGVGEAAAVARAEGGENRIIVYCTARDSTEDAVRAWCRAELKSVHRPAQVVVLDALPMLSAGKIDLVELARQDAAISRAESDFATLGPVEDDFVAQVWRERLGAESLAADARFEEAGGDSLQAMMIILDLERRFGHRLPNGLIDWQTRPSELAARIAAQGAQSGVASAVRPLLFFFPGAFGADFASGEFAQLVDTAFSTVLLDYRGAGAELIGLVDREDVFREMDARIAAERAPQRLWLVGYSLGARIAVEAARRLIERGISVEFVGLIDGPSDSFIAERVARQGVAAPPRPPLGRRIAFAGGAWGFATTQIVSRLAHRMVTRNDFPGLQRLAATLSRWRFKAAASEVMRVSLTRTRVKAFKNIAAGPLLMPATLFVSTAPYSQSHSSPDLGWTPWCQGLDIIKLDGDHSEILEGAQAAHIVEVLRDTEARLRPTLAA